MILEKLKYKYKMLVASHKFLACYVGDPYEEYIPYVKRLSKGINQPLYKYYEYVIHSVILSRKKLNRYIE